MNWTTTVNNNNDDDDDNDEKMHPLCCAVRLQTGMARALNWDVRMFRVPGKSGQKIETI